MSLTLADGFPSYLDLYCALSSTPGLGRKNMAKSVDSVVGTPLCPGNLHSRQFPGEMRWESTWGGGGRVGVVSFQKPDYNSLCFPRLLAALSVDLTLKAFWDL